MTISLRGAYYHKDKVIRQTAKETKVMQFSGVSHLICKCF